jgi:DNA-binding NarL/FixJ family response regulator
MQKADAMSTASLRTATVIVVDPNHEDYADLLTEAHAADVNVRILSTGSAALRYARHCRGGLWLVNTQLPDMSGFDLAQMLLHRCFDLRVFMVGDDYDVEEELQTLATGLSMYVCKPLAASWIAQWGLPRLASGRNREPLIVSAFQAEMEGVGAAAVAADRGQHKEGDFVPENDELPTILPFPRRNRRRPAA